VNVVAGVETLVRYDIIGARNPDTLPQPVRQFSGILKPGAGPTTPVPWQDIVVPQDLRDATPERQAQFRAGRYCALRALEALESRAVTATLSRAPDGVPRWPAGTTGSITHSGDFVSAAVARTSDVGALGIDSERVMSAERAARVSVAIAWASEVAHARTIGCDRLQALTLVFSAKEAIFKCLYRSVGRVFDYRDVRITRVEGRTFSARLARSLSDQFPAQTLLHGRFDIDGRWIHTGIALPPRELTASR
jgi:enterobactin synthetase component D